jgi:lysophospholipase L1-like esterase
MLLNANRSKLCTCYFVSIALSSSCSIAALADETYTENPGPEGNGDFVIGPDAKIDPKLTNRGNPQGKYFEFSMRLADNKIFPGNDAPLDSRNEALMGCSFGGAAALTAGWFRPDLFPHLITYSGTFVDQEHNLRWHDVSELSVEGRAWTETKHPYDRLPAKAEMLVRPPVWDLAQHSSGLSVRFVTNATAISARWSLRSRRLEMPHMPATGVSGVDLYVKDDGRWHYLATGRPTRAENNESVLVRDLEPVEREFRLYLPLYNGLEKLEFGVPDATTFKPAPPIRAGLRPLVFYGTSITQGGCASRPGMAYPAILGRMLDVPTINLGFSGNGKTEPEMAHLLSEINAAAYVLDSLPNLDTAQVGERLPAFIDILRQRHPTVPIVLVESIPYPDKPFVAKRNERFIGSNDTLRRIYNERRQQGDQRVYYVPSHSFLGLNGEATVDGVHPTDLGFQNMAESLALHLRLIPRLIPPAARPGPADEQFTPLFDGQSLSGWERLDTIPAEHVGGKWKVEEGVLIGDQDPPGRGGFLATKEKYRDFVLRLEVQQDFPTDTGVFVRVGEDGKSHQLTLDFRPQGEMGAIFLPWTQSRVLRNPEGIKFYKPGEWNDVMVRAEGEPARLRMWLNGTLITDFQHTAESTRGVPIQGRIALQVHPDVPNLTTWKPGNTVRYRNIRVHRLNAP